MLTCYGDEVGLPQSDLAYVGFRLAALDTLCQMGAGQGLDDEGDEAFGYLAVVPILAEVAPAVQVGLLADVWARHQGSALHAASLLDAAVVYAAFQTAGRVIAEERGLARAWLKAGPRKVRCRLGDKAPEQLRDLFFDFWDDIDFLSLEALQDLPPAEAHTARDLLGLPEGDVEEIEEALGRGRASPAVLTNLAGLLSASEIQGFARVLLNADTR
jgi:hypothetical protein